MFSIKICGITNVKDGQLAALAGADAIGLNFYEDSPRFVNAEIAGKLSQVVPAKVQRVGLFVNAAAELINQHCEALRLDFIQLHGDEPPEFLAELCDVPIVRAFRFGGDNMDEIAAYLDACSRAPTAVLIDAKIEGEFGGTGEAVDWESLAAAKEQLGDMPLVLAGGLDPFNVEEAVETVRPSAVDTASGVESKAGSKDPMLMRAFVNAAKRALQALQADGT